jgi:uncharacterized repeat protein (TIGR01451 family)/fimbrial isopeptide formation D2 family protein
MGEVLTFEVTSFFPDGTTLEAVVSDQLPFLDARLRLLSSRIVSIGPDISIGNGQGVGAPGIDCQTTTCQTGGNGYDDLALWDLGTVINNPEIQDRAFSSNGLITFEVVAVVQDDPANVGEPQGADNYLNEATLAAQNQLSTAVAPFGLVEPRLELMHTGADGLNLVPIEAGSEVMVELLIRHAASSSSAAFDLTIDYELDSSLSLPPGFTVNTDCAGLTTDSATPGQLSFSLAELTLEQDSCRISFLVAVDPLLIIPNSLADRSTLNWVSAPGGVPEARSGQATADLRYVAGVENRLSKAVTSSSLLYTSSGQLNPARVDLSIGERVTFAITATLDRGTLGNVQIYDVLPAGGPDGALLIEDASVIRVGSNLSSELDGIPVIDFTNNDVTFDFGSVQNNGIETSSGIADQVTVQVVARVAEVADNPPSPPEITNTAELRFDGGTPVTAERTVDIVEPGLTLTKSFGELRNNRVEVTLTLSNPGNAPAFSSVVTDLFPETGPDNWEPLSMDPVTVPDGWLLEQASAGGVTTVTWQVNPLSLLPRPSQVVLPGASISAVFTMGLQAPPEQTSILNTADATAFSLPGGGPDAREVNAEGEDTLLLPGLEVRKTWSAGSGSFAAPGEQITYTLELENTGDAPLTGVVVSDVPDPLGLFQAGSVVASPGGVVLVGNLPDDTSVEVEFAQIDAGTTATVSYGVRVPLPYPAATVQQYVNQALVTSLELPDQLSDDPLADGDEDPTIVPIVADPVMSITKQSLADVVGAGGSVFYQIEYANAGDQDATGVVITDTVPDTNVNSSEARFNAAASSPGWSCPDGSLPGTLCTLTIGDLAGGEGGTLLFVVDIDDPLEEGVDSISNTVFISDDGLNTDPENCDPDCERTASDSDVTPILAAPVLEITKDDGISFAVPGQLVTYTLDVRNTGTQDATGIVVSDTVGAWVRFSAAASSPGWSCPDGSGPGTVCTISAPELSAGESAQVQFAVLVDAPLPAGVDLSVNLASVTDDGTNSDNGAPVFDQASHDTPLVAQPDMVIDKDDGGVIGQPGLVFPYTLSYTNQGNQDATGVFITDTVPVGTTYDSVASLPDAWSCPDAAPAGTVCTLVVGDLAAGGTGSVRFGVRVDQPVAPGLAAVVNTAVIDDDRSNGADPTPENNTDTVETLVILFPPAGRKSGEDLGGGRTRWSMTWFNNANQRDLPVIILDPMPAGTNYATGTLSCTPDGDSVCESAVFNAEENRIEVRTTIAPDFGFPDFTPNLILSNEVVIAFETISTSAARELTNRAEACWDENNTGDPGDDLEQGQECVPVSARVAINFAIPGLDRQGQLLLVLLLLMLAGVSWRRVQGQMPHSRD